MPDPTEVMVAKPQDNDMHKRVRVGEALAAGASLAAVFYIAEKNSSAKPYLYWGGGIAAVILFYEFMRSRDSGCGCGE